MIRRVAVLTVALAVTALGAACSSNTSGHGSARTSSGPATGGASTAVATSGHASATTSATSSVDADWASHVNFGALPHPDMGCAGAGLGGKVDVAKVVTADVTGDGVPDAIVRLECAHSASEWPDTVDVYSDATGHPVMIGMLLSAHGDSYATDISTSGTSVTLSLTTWSSFAPGCCPDLQYTQRFTWNGSGFTAGPRLDKLHPCGDTAIVTAAGPTQGATGHSSVVLLFRNRLPQPCTLTGYPGLDATSPGGSVLAHASRTLNGFAGGAHSIASVTVPAGGKASATAEWMNFDPTGGGSCTSSAAIMVTPANTSATTTLPISVTVCGLQIHPTVAGTTGSA